MKKAHVKNVITIVLISIIIGFVLAYAFFIAPLNKSKSYEIIKHSNISKKIIPKDVITGKLHEKKELVTLDVDLSEKISIDDSWGSLSIFKKISNINFAGTGTYIISLSNVKAESLSIIGNTLIVKIPPPSVKSITIDPDKTTFEKTENGLLRFGDIKLTPSDNLELTKVVQDKMKTKMLNSELYDKAKEQSLKVAQEFIKSLIPENLYGSYSVKVQYE